MRKALNIFLISASTLVMGVYGYTLIYSNIVVPNREEKAKAAYDLRVQQHPLSTASILSDVNDQRTSHGMSTLSLNPEVQKASEAKCSDMVTKSYYDHTGPDGRTIKDWLNDSTKNWKFGNENLNKGNFRASFEVVDSWMNSPGHKNTMLDAKFTDTGIAVCNSLDGQKIIVEQFAQYFTAEEIKAATPQSTNVNVYQRKSPVTCHSYDDGYATTYCY